MRTIFYPGVSRFQVPIEVAVRPSLRRELALEFCSVGWAESNIYRLVLVVILKSL